MSISDIFKAVACCSCGLCGLKEHLCEACEISTLKANGLPENMANEIRGLKYKSRNHGNSFEFSELYIKINQLIKKDNEK